jgi:hypothetical protein
MPGIGGAAPVWTLGWAGHGDDLLLIQLTGMASEQADGFFFVCSIEY